VGQARERQRAGTGACPYRDIKPTIISGQSIFIASVSFRRVVAPGAAVGVEAAVVGIIETGEDDAFFADGVEEAVGVEGHADVGDAPVAGIAGAEEEDEVTGLGCFWGREEAA